ncbi:uncharacterized protein LOC128275959, partial [Anopheles cruzii]|uniref:uncharacterized protein LOC128275959 n=1 Tax=Anopheles cruzii TaxID=68878 RepID=UPI0022EC95E2
MRARSEVSRQRSAAATAATAAVQATVTQCQGPSAIAGVGECAAADGSVRWRPFGRRRTKVSARGRGWLPFGATVLLAALLGPPFDVPRGPDSSGRGGGGGGGGGGVVSGSEFPERECCDPVYPPMPDLDGLPGPVYPTTTISTSSFQTGGGGGAGAEAGGGELGGGSSSGGLSGGGGGGGPGAGNQLSSSRPMHIGYS